MVLLYNHWDIQFLIKYINAEFLFPGNMHSSLTTQTAGKQEIKSQDVWVLFWFHHFLGGLWIWTGCLTFLIQLPCWYSGPISPACLKILLRSNKIKCVKALYKYELLIKYKHANFWISFVQTETWYKKQPYSFLFP